MTSTHYRDKIDHIFTKMFAIRPYDHVFNRDSVDAYLYAVWKRTSTITSSVLGTQQPSSLWQRFHLYVDSEEERLRKNLQVARYSIDAMDTLSLITGGGRIERVRNRLICPAH